MEMLTRMEESDELIQDGQKIRGFLQEINNTHDKNINIYLDKCLEEFIDKYESEESDITHKLRMFVQYIKNNNIK